MIGYVQSNKGSRSTAGALAVAYSSNVTAGNLLVIAIGCHGGSVAGASISDTQGNTWQPLLNFSLSNSNVGLWAAIANGSGANTVTVTVGAGAANDLIVAEYSGASRFIDGYGAISGSLTTSVTVPTIKNFSSSGDLILSAAYDQTHSSTPSYSADFTIRQFTANPDLESLSLADFITSSSGSHGGETFSLSASSSGITLISVGLIPTPSGGGGGSSPIPVAENLLGGLIGVSYSETIGAQAGTSPYTYAVTSGALPTGCSLNTSTGVISGTPSASGTFTFTITVTDSLSNTGSQAFQIIIAAPAGGGSYTYLG